MSATSVELASQSEELQASISYFRTEAKTTGHTMRKPAPKKRERLERTQLKGSPKAASVAEQQERVKGFALDLTRGGPDSDDEQFKEYA